MLRHVILRGWVSSGVSRSARETVGGGGEGGARSRDGSHEHRNGDGRVKAGRRGRGEGGKRGGLKGSLAEILGKSSVKSHQNIPLAKTTTYSYHHCPLGIGGIRLRKILILLLPPPLSPFQKSPFSRLLLNFFSLSRLPYLEKLLCATIKFLFKFQNLEKQIDQKKKKKIIDSSISHFFTIVSPPWII